MYVKPLTRVIERPIGYVVDSHTILGEWDGTRWEDVPYKAALYANERSAVEERYQRGELEAIRWVRRERGYGRITGWKWHHPTSGNPHNVYFLRGTLKSDSPSVRFTALTDFVSIFRGYGTNIGSPIGMLGSLFKRTLREPLYQDERALPTNELWRGSRIQHRGGIAAEFPRSTLWDMRSAFPAALGSVYVPRRWRHYQAKAHEPLPSSEAGFVRAIVRTDKSLGGIGPLPDTRMIPATYPSDEWLQGVWSLDELRAAERWGSEVAPLEYWTAHGFEQPFSEWLAFIAAARSRLHGDAERLLKMAANGYVGTLAMQGQRAHSVVLDDGTEKYWTEKGYKKPDSLSTHALVTAGVRARLYDEALAPWSLLFVSCHTDGAIIMDTDTQLVGTGLGAAPGDWLEKRHMQRVLLLDAQRYAWENERGELRYCVSGVPERYVERTFLRRWSGSVRSRLVPRRKIPEKVSPKGLTGAPP